jgi:hypothetical protein
MNDASTSEPVPAATEPVEINERGRRQLFRVYHNEGQPIVRKYEGLPCLRKLKQMRKQAKKDAKRFLREASKKAGRRVAPGQTVTANGE